MLINPLKIAILGAGAIGSVLGFHLFRAGHHVSLIVRGDHGRAVRECGLRFLGANGEEHASIDSFSDHESLGVQDLVFLTTKSQGAELALRGAGHIFGDDSLLVSAMNGIPWWYFTGGNQGERFPVRSVDPDGTLLSLVDPNRLIGAVVHFGAALTAPGVVKMGRGSGLVVGEIDN